MRYFILALYLFVFILPVCGIAANAVLSPASDKTEGQELTYLARYLVDSADEFAANGEYIQAQRYIERALRENPDSEFLNEKHKEFRALTGLTRALPPEDTDSIPAVSWESIQADIAELSQKGDKEGLERLYTELAKNEDYYSYAMINRGFLRAELGKLEEARADLLAALAGPGDIVEGRDDIEKAVAQFDAEINKRNDLKNIQNKIKSLSDKKDWEGLENYYTSLSANPQYEAMALYSRGELRMSRGEMLKARDDFVRFTTIKNADPKAKASAESMIAKIDAGFEKERKRARMQAHIAELTEAEDWEGLDDYYTRMFGDPEYGALALANRGFLRWEQNDPDAGRADLILSLETPGLEPDMRRSVEEAIAYMDSEKENLARQEAENPWGYLLSARENIDAGDYAEAESALYAVSGLPLEDDAEGMYHLLRGDLLRAQGADDEAYALDMAASEFLPDGFFLSEILWKMAEYNREAGNKDAAAEYARRSAHSSPDNEWRQIEAGNMLRDFSRWDESLEYYEAALSVDVPLETQLLIYQNMGAAYINMGDREAYLNTLRRRIDLLNAKIDGQEVRDTDTETALHAARREYADFTKKIEFSSYLFGNIYGNNDYLYQTRNELNWRFYSKGWLNVRLYGQVNAVLSSKFSGTYFATWSGSYEKYESSASFSDTLEFVAGLRATLPLPGASLAIDRVFPVSSDVSENTRVILSHYWDKGGNRLPYADRWLFVSTYNEGVYSITEDDVTGFGEARLGYAFGIGNRNMLVPYVSGVWGYGGESIDLAERWSLEVGPGVFFRSWYREDTYSAPKSFFDIIVQYRFGLSHDRENVFSLTLVNYF